MTTFHRYLPLALLLVAGACKKAPEAATADTLMAGMAGMAGMPAVDPEVQLAANITIAIRSHPGITDSILSAYGVTAAKFESMMYTIAADSAKSVTFKHITGG